MNVLTEPRARAHRPPWYVLALFAGVALAMVFLFALIAWEVVHAF